MTTPAIQVTWSNRTERLADRLADLLATPVGGPFDPETIVVQGRGMAVWLSQQLARRHRVVANVDFTYPRNVVTRAFEQMLGADAVEQALATDERILWSVLAELPKLLSQPQLDRVRRYLADDPKGVRRFQLADRIAGRFDQYLTFRPEMMLDWDRGEDGELSEEQRWQPIVWRALRAAGASGRHLAALAAEYAEKRRAGARLDGMPRRLTLFGMSTLPPLLLRVIASFAPEVDVHIFALSPSPKDWWNQVPREQIVEALAEGKDPETLHLDLGSPLLASMGALGSEFRRVLEQGVAEAGVEMLEHELFTRPEGGSMLAELQRGAYELSSEDADRTLLSDEDRSVTVHACHGPMREIEVLHDQLLDLLTAEGSTLEPQDVVVMMPDVDTYAPFVEAVFDRARGDHAIPYKVSDRSTRADSPVIAAFSRVLGLVGGRAEASAVLDLLNLEPVRAQFGLDAADLDTVTDWVVASGARWGIDSEHRKEHGQPAVSQNTWHFALDRLLLGYALVGDGTEEFAGVLPFEELEGRETELLGRLAEFTERLFRAVRSLEAPRPLARWHESLAEMLAAMIASDSRTAWQHQRILDGLAGVLAEAGAAGFDVEGESVDLAVARSLVERRIDASYPERGFLQNGVTFCAMVPMRSIPFRVVCLVGMNDGAYPRTARAPEFDLIEKGPGGRRPGDRDRRKDDRFLFLEALLAARERLIVTYTGQSIRDNSPRPPSVVVGDLLDRIEQRFDPEGPPKSEIDRADRVRERLVVRHPLQAFSARYFDGKDPRLFSYARENLEGARHLGTDRREPSPLFVEPLPPLALDGDVDRAVSLAELVRFYEDPTAYLLSRRLGVYVRDSETDVPDREPVELGGLERWQLGRDALEESLSGIDPERSERLARDRGHLPLGRYGALVHARIRGIAQEIAAQAGELRAVGPRGPLSVNHALPDGTRLTGEVGDLFGSRRVRHQYSGTSVKYLLRMWVPHLVLCWVAGEDAESVLIGKGKKAASTVTFARVDRPADHLADLVRWYREGLRAPLRFVPGASYAYAAHTAAGKDDAFAIAKARSAYDRPENGDVIFAPHLLRVFGAARPAFDDVAGAVGDFRELSTQLLGPLIASTEAS